jgi:nitroreductase
MTIDKQADTQTPINSLMASRWSGRAYYPKRDVTNHQLLAIVEAARWAPSCFGDQPWCYIICHKSADPSAWQNAFDCLVEGNQQWQ